MANLSEKKTFIFLRGPYSSLGSFRKCLRVPNSSMGSEVSNGSLGSFRSAFRGPASVGEKTKENTKI